MRRIVFLAVVLATASTLVPVAPAQATSSFTFFGSGYGHGIGLSQWGAFGLASDGWSHQQILTHFYTGTAVATDTPLPTKLRVGLTVDRHLIHLKAASGTVSLWEGAPPTGTAIGTIPSGKTWTVRALTSGAFKIVNALGATVGGRTWGSRTESVFATFADTGARVFVPEADQIYGSGFTYAHGDLEFDTYPSGGKCCLERLILRIPFEQYLLGIGEVSSTWPMEALESQVDASRTYAAYVIRHWGIRSSCNCHLTDGGNDETYVGWSKESGTGGDRWVTAVEDTRGEVVTYQGALIQAFFTASDGGHTENVEDAWHGGDSRYAIPYLRGVCDPGENTSSNPWVSWQRAFTADYVTTRLRPYTGSIGTISGFSGDVRGISGRIITIVAKGTTGSSTLTGSELRAALGLPDDRVWVNTNRNVVGAIRSLYDRLDCSPGLPTSPSLVLPDGSRQLFTGGGIYQNTTAGVVTFLKGPILVEYRAIGGVYSVLGLPASQLINLPLGGTGCTVCTRVDFDHGRVYQANSTGAYALWGAVLAAYLGDGGAGGALGFPTSRVVTANDGSTSATFEHGSIACSPSGSCSVS
jgi:SpoIID/LytB domain protein